MDRQRPYIMWFDESKERVKNMEINMMILQSHGGKGIKVMKFTIEQAMQLWTVWSESSSSRESTWVVQ